MTAAQSPVHWRSDPTAAVPFTGTPSEGVEVFEALDAAVVESLRQTGVPGLVVAIMQDGRLPYAKGFGISALPDRPTLATDLFRFASVTKTVTAVAVLRLIQDGAIVPRTGEPLTLDTLVFGEVFPYEAPARSPNLGMITVRHLLEHRSGLAEAFLTELNDAFFLAAGPKEFVMVEQAMARDALAPAFINAPGAAVGYRNEHYHVLGDVITAVSGLSYTDYLTRTFFEPLGLHRMRISKTIGQPQAGGLFETQYFADPKEGDRGVAPAVGTDWIADYETIYPASSIAASPIDLLRFMASIDGSASGPRSLDPTRFRWIVTEATNVNDFGLGFATPVHASGRALEHGGFIPGSTSAVLQIRLEDGISIAFASNAVLPHPLLAQIDAILDRMPLPGLDFSDMFEMGPCGDWKVRADESLGSDETPTAP